MRKTGLSHSVALVNLTTSTHTHTEEFSRVESPKVHSTHVFSHKHAKQYNKMWITERFFNTCTLANLETNVWSKSFRYYGKGFTHIPRRRQRRTRGAQGRCGRRRRRMRIEGRDGRWLYARHYLPAVGILVKRHRWVWKEEMSRATNSSSSQKEGKRFFNG